MIKLWTVQDASVLETIKNDGVYYPDVKSGLYTNLVEGLDRLYYYMVACYNYNNNTSYKGLVFSFMGDDGEYIAGFPNYEFFKAYVAERKNAIESLWKTLNRPGAVVLELEYEDDFNPIFMDINDFQYLMPPQQVIPPFSKESEAYILLNAAHGVFEPSAYPSRLYQAHVGEIRRENVVGVYPMFEI